MLHKTPFQTCHGVARKGDSFLLQALLFIVGKKSVIEFIQQRTKRTISKEKIDEGTLENNTQCPDEQNNQKYDDAGIHMGNRAFRKEALFAFRFGFQIFHKNIIVGIAAQKEQFQSVIRPSEPSGRKNKAALPIGEINCFRRHKQKTSGIFISASQLPYAGARHGMQRFSFADIIPVQVKEFNSPIFMQTDTF